MLGKHHNHYIIEAYFADED